MPITRPKTGIVIIVANRDRVSTIPDNRSVITLLSVANSSTVFNEKGDL